jgi:hypothetical protein
MSQFQHFKIYFLEKTGTEIENITVLRNHFKQAKFFSIILQRPFNWVIWQTFSLTCRQSMYAATHFLFLSAAENTCEEQRA